MSRGRIGVVGAGLGGLHLAWRLAQLGYTPRVFEADGEPGGVIRTVGKRGRVLELGPQRTRQSPMMRRLVDELGLGDRLVTAPADLPIFVYRNSRLGRVPLSFEGLLRTDLLSIRTKLRMLLEPFTPAPREDETVAGYLIRRFGRTAYEDLLGPLLGGLYASDPRDMLVRHALAPLLRDLGAGRSAIVTLVRRGRRRAGASPPLSFRGGMSELPHALHARVREHVRLGTPVRALRPAAGGFEVVTDHDAERVDRVILTTPADITAGLLDGFADDAAARLRRLRYNRLVVVHLLSDARIRGLGFQTSFAEPLETRGVTFNHTLFGEGREGVHTAFLGGAGNPGLADAPDDVAAGIAVREFRQVTGHDAEPIHVSRTRIPAWDRTWTALEGLTVPEGVYLCANWESRVGIPGRIARAEQVARSIGAGAEATAV